MGLSLTPHIIQTRFSSWAQAEEALRAAFIVGSQARLDHPADAWSDLDLILFLADDQVETYLGRSDWLEQFVPIWLSHLGRTVAGEPERLVLYAGGLQVDFVFHPASELARAKEMLLSGALPDTLLRGVRVLVDKDGMIPELPPPARPRPATPPSGEAFRQALDDFWFNAVYCAKQLRRGELWMFQNGSLGMQWSLLGMLEW
ncbi:MAG TPA: aminoglycoside 6-adenylyltransferase, partial [Anaerolinea sp.]|nr:aminoglycoside 6-adenylyltransferase [Anaerolinea sp.]